LTIDNKVFFVKSKFEEAGYHLLVTDLVSVWHRHADSEQLEAEKKLYNPHLELPRHRLVALMKRFFGSDIAAHSTDEVQAQSHLEDKSSSAEVFIANCFVFVRMVLCVSPFSVS